MQKKYFVTRLCLICYSFLSLNLADGLRAESYELNADQIENSVPKENIEAMSNEHTHLNKIRENNHVEDQKLDQQRLDNKQYERKLDDATYQRRLDDKRSRKIVGA